MNILISIAENVIGALGETVVLLGKDTLETKGVLFRNPKSNELSDYIHAEKVILYVLDSVEASVGQRLVYKGEEFEITRISKENGTKKLGLKCPKEHKLEKILP